LQARVLGHVEARGVCGSGLVDAVAGALDLRLILPSGRFAVAGDLPLAERVHLRQTDVRELQLAKGAITAGVRLLAQEMGAGLEDIQCVYLAGAFGNCINRRSARRIGLLPFALERIRSVGNAALLGAKQALFLPREEDPDFGALRRMVKHVSLNDLPTFHDDYVMEMGFPAEKTD